MLDQFGLSYFPGSASGVNYDLSKLQSFINSKDNAFYDLTIDGAAEINKSIKTQPGVYYYSYAGTKTSRSIWTGNYTPNFGINVLLFPYAYAIGRYTGVTAGGRVIDEKWLENDGLVNQYRPARPLMSLPLCTMPVRRLNRGSGTSCPLRIWTILNFREVC